MKTGIFTDYLGNKMWLKNGELHNPNGPAYISRDGHKYWYLNGINHRVDGPAVEFANGKSEWYLCGHKINFVMSIKILPQPK